MNYNFRVAFHLSGRLHKDGKSTINYRILLGTDRLSMGSTSFSVEPARWNSNKGRAVGATTEARYINSQLDNMESDLRTIFRKLEFTEDLTLDRIKSEYLRRKDEPVEKSFLAYFDLQIQKKEREVDNGIVIGTLKKYRTVRKRFAEYLMAKYKRTDVMFSELDYKLMSGFEHYLRVDTGIEYNTAKGRMKTVKAIVNEAKREELIFKDPFQGITLSFEPVDRGFLTEVEIKKLMNYDFTIDRLEKVRDIFVFSCFTGFAYTDVANLTYNNIIEMGGRQWIVKSREKTKVASNVPLLPIPLQIIEKYRGTTKDNHILPILSNQRMNCYLKEIAAVCGIDKNLTFHLARHTFGTLSVSMGVPFDSVSKMMGHTNLKTTMIYARITNNKIGGDMDKLAGQLGGTFDKQLTNMHLPTIKQPMAEEPQVVEEQPRVIAESKPTKQGGRKKKEDKVEVVTAPAPTITKKRGRPKKDVEPVPATPITPIPTPVKKRGRPSKSQSTPSVEVSSLKTTAKPKVKTNDEVTSEMPISISAVTPMPDGTIVFTSADGKKFVVNPAQAR